MKLSLTADSATNRRFILLAPAGVTPRGAFRQVEGNPARRQDLLHDMQRLRGRIYLSDGAITREELTATDAMSRRLTRIPGTCWWWATTVESWVAPDTCSTTASTPYNSLRVRTAALAQSEQWSEPLRRAVERELEDARRNGFSYVEVGGWALDESVRGSSDALRSVLFTYAWSQVIGGCLGLSMATHRNGSAVDSASYRRTAARVGRRRNFPPTTIRTTNARWKYCVSIREYPVSSTST